MKKEIPKIILTFCLCILVILSKKVYAYTETDLVINMNQTTNSSTLQNNNNSLNVVQLSTGQIGTRDAWLKTVKEWTEIMLEDGDWIYSNTNNYRYYQDARNASSRRTNCALFVVHALQRFGVFNKNHKFYSRSDGTTAYNNDTEARIKQIADVIEYKNGISPKDTDLKPGDICLWGGTGGHTNVFAGYNNSGIRTWYDAGSGMSGGDGKVFKNFYRVGNMDGSSMKIYKIIRLHYGDTFEATALDEENVLEQDTDNLGTTIDLYSEMPSLETGDFTCENIFFYQDEYGERKEKEIKKLLDEIFSLMKIIAPIIAIALSIVDYIKTLTTTENMKKANVRMVKRMIIAIAIIFLPYLLDALFKLFGLYDFSRCEIG